MAIGRPGDLFSRRNYNRDIPALDILLMLYVPVAGKQHIPPAFGEEEEFTILLGPESGPTHGFAFMTVGCQDRGECSREALVKQNSHFPKRARRRALASSKAATACNRVTPGY